jgi:hypothetical protein
LHNIGYLDSLFGVRFRGLASIGWSLYGIDMYQDKFASCGEFRVNYSHYSSDDGKYISKTHNSKTLYPITIFTNLCPFTKYTPPKSQIPDPNSPSHSTLFDHIKTSISQRPPKTPIRPLRPRQHHLHIPNQTSLHLSFNPLLFLPL